MVGAILLFGACTDTYSPVEIPTAPETPKSAVIVNTPDEAISGELMIKFRPEVDRIIEQIIDKKHQCLWNCHPFGYSWIWTAP